MHGAVRSGPEIWKYTASSWGGGTQFSRTNRTAPAGQHRASTQRISHPAQEPVCEICHTGNPDRSEKLLSESGSRPARGPEPVRGLLWWLDLGRGRHLLALETEQGAKLGAAERVHARAGRS